MSLFKRGNTWWVRFTSPSGERMRRSAGTTDKKQAQEYHDQLKAESWKQQKMGEKPRRTWKEAAIKWLKETDHKATHNKDIMSLRWLDQFLGSKYLDEITRDDLTTIGETKRDESNCSTANRYLSLVRAILMRSRDEWEWISSFPKVRLFKEPKKRVRFLSEKEARRLLGELPGHLRDMAMFSLATGLRQANVSYLTWNQVDILRKVAWIYADQAKTGKTIAVPLNEIALDVLHHRKGTDPEYVFTYNGKPVDRTSTKAWKNALQRAGIENFRWHDLRHTWASWHVQNGTSLQELMELGGWSSYEMVLRYAHLAGDHLLEAANRISGTKLAQSYTD